MIKLDIRCLVLIIGSVEVGPDMDMKFRQEVMEIVSYDIMMQYALRIENFVCSHLHHIFLLKSRKQSQC